VVNDNANIVTVLVLCKLFLYEIPMSDFSIKLHSFTTGSDGELVQYSEQEWRLIL
jgi:hypothetical protein